MKKGDGREYFQIDDVKIEMKLRRFWMYFGNLFNGNKVMEDFVNNFLNNNWEELYREFLPKMTGVFQKIYQDIFSNFFNKNSYKELFN